MSNEQLTVYDWMRYPSHRRWRLGGLSIGTWPRRSLTLIQLRVSRTIALKPRVISIVAQWTLRYVEVEVHIDIVVVAIIVVTHVAGTLRRRVHVFVPMRLR